MLDVPLGKLMCRTKQHVAADHVGPGMQQCGDILKLIPKAECTARLVEATARPIAAGEGLVEQPPIRQQIECGVGGLNRDGTQCAFPKLPDLIEHALCRLRLLKLPHDVPCLVDIATHSQREDNFLLSPIDQFESGLEGPAGIESRPHLVGQTLPGHRRGPGRAAVASQKFHPIPRHRPLRLRDIEECDSLRELEAERIPGEYSPTLRIHFRDDVHQPPRPHLSQHPFDIPCGRQATCPSRVVADLQPHEFDGLLDSDVDPQLGGDAGLGVFVDAVPQTMAADVRRRRSDRLGHG